MFGKEGKEKYEVELKVPPSNYLNLPMPIRERHLTQECFRMRYEAQSAGTHLQCLLESERDSILIKIPYSTWRTGPPRSRKLNDWALYLDRWADDFEVDRRVEEHNTEKRIVTSTVEIMDKAFLEEKK
jgi:hypothetical protein